MKKGTLPLIVMFVLLASGIKAQNLIAVQNGGTPAFYLQVDSAIIHSQDGDTIYIPGGTWNGSILISKRLHIFGVGHNPDSTNATFPTKILGGVILQPGASQGTLTGVFLTGPVQTTNEAFNFYTVKRCRINGTYIYSTDSYFTFIENIIEGQFFLYGPNGGPSNCSFFNNIISAYFSQGANQRPFTNSSFTNNIFLYSQSSGVYSTTRFPIYSQYSLFENNIFLGWTNNFQQVSNSNFNNNIFGEGINFETGTNIGLNNITYQSPETIFIQPGAVFFYGYVFSYTNDYHLLSTSAGKNAGTDGTDIGIYGGFYPWKEGSIPYNPHIQVKNISNKTDQNGNLNINIKVASQNQ